MVKKITVRRPPGRGWTLLHVHPPKYATG